MTTDDWREVLSPLRDAIAALPEEDRDAAADLAAALIVERVARRAGDGVIPRPFPATPAGGDAIEVPDIIWE